MKKAQSTTCGVIITDGEHMLICHPTNGKHWDIPKGKMDDGETMAETASRELNEETGLKVRPSMLFHIGVFDYKPEKRLSLFAHRVSSMPDVDTLFCASEFDDHGVMTKEMDNFMVVTIDDGVGMLNNDMARILSIVFQLDD